MWHLLLHSVMSAAPEDLVAERWPLPDQAQAVRQRRLSEAVSLARLSEVCHLYIPLQPPLDLPGARSGSLKLHIPQVHICFTPACLHGCKRKE
jgi:hypothetical protein